MAELKPCPKCGGKNVEVTWEGTIGKRWSCGRCKDCLHRGPQIDDWNDEKAAELWNKKA